MAMGLFSGAGGDAIARELFSRQSQTGTQSANGVDALNGILKAIPQFLEVQGRNKYYGALQQKAQTEAQAEQIKTQLRAQAAKMLGEQDPLTAALYGAGDLSGDVAQTRANAYQGGAGVVEQIAGMNPNFAGGNTDPGFRKQLLQSVGGDVNKALELANKIKADREQALVDADPEYLADKLNRVQQNLADPKVVEAYKAARIPEAAIPDQVLFNTLKEMSKERPEVAKLLLSKFADGGIDNISNFAYEQQKRHYEMQKNEADVQKTQATTKVLLDMAPLKADKIKSEIRKNDNRPGGQGGGGARPKEGSNNQLNDSQTLNIQRDIDKNEAILADPDATDREKALAKKSLPRLQSQLNSGVIKPASQPTVAKQDVLKQMLFNALTEMRK